MDHITVVYETGWKSLAKFNPAPHHLEALDVFVEDDARVCVGESWNYRQCPIKSLQVSAKLDHHFCRQSARPALYVILIVENILKPLLYKPNSHISYHKRTRAPFKLHSTR